MAVQTFLSRIEQAGFTMRAEGDRLIVSPFSKLTDEQREFIRRHKDELLVELAVRRWMPGGECEKSYHVASLRTRNMITTAKNSDNTHDNNRATESLKALAGAALRRNQERNKSATCTQKTAQQSTVFSPSKVITPEASELRDIRAW